MVVNDEELRRWLEDLEEYVSDQEVLHQKAMAAAIVHALRVMEDNGDMMETVKAMLELDEGLVSKLEFVISSAFVEKGLHHIEGGRYAH